ncbi:MAG: S41 family peptidase [Planctomycetota bacterium]
MPSSHSLALLLPLVVALPTDSVATQEAQPLGFEKGSLGEAPRSWFVPQAVRGWQAVLVEDDAPAGERYLRLEPTGDDASQVGNAMAMLPVGELAGRRVQLTAQIKVPDGGHAQMWLRVDRAEGQRGGFDNMSDRPITSPRWTEASIELEVDEDATRLALGVLAFGGAAACVDDMALEVVGAARSAQPPSPAAELSDRELQNAVAATRLLGYLWFFHPSDALVELNNWDNFAVELLETALPARTAQELVLALNQFIQPFAPTVELWWHQDEVPPPPGIPDAASHYRFWQHRGAGRIARGNNVYSSRVVKRRLQDPPPDEIAARHEHVVDLGRIRARVPMVVWANRRRTLPAAELPAAWHNDQLPRLSAKNRNTRLAAVAQAWCVFEHFYPYFDVTDVDWRAQLDVALRASAVAADGEAAADAIARLVGSLDDGHGRVMGGSRRDLDGYLPVALRWAGADLVICGLGSGVEDVRIGEVVESIDGAPVTRLHDQMVDLVSSATPGWTRYRTQMMFARWPTQDPVRLALRGPDGKRRDMSLARVAEFVADQSDERPANGSAVAEGIVYFDLNRAPTEELDKHLEALAAAKGIIFDMRGYPDSAAKDVVELLMTDRGQSAIWGVPRIESPDRSTWEWDGAGRWQLRPREPHLAAKVAFLTDGRAISYAESIMGIVEAYRLGEIIGATTAGTNGNVNPFEVAGGFRISWTGMRVLKHDGSRHHGVGIAPTVPVEPTAKGIAAGQDEVLDRAVAVLQKQIGG